MRIITTTFTSILLLFLFNNSFAQLSPYDAAKAIGRGINMGNTLDAPKYEGEWAPKAEEYYFDAYKEAGFQSVRIPITWDVRVSKTAPYEVDPEFMDRVEQVVDWGLERDLIVIMNCHHDDWLKDDYSEANIARFEAIWTQISDRFHTKSDSLLFEALNEPHGLTIAQAADANQRALDIIRIKNPTRNVIIGGNGWTAIKDLLTMPIPKNDDHLIGYFHTYDPWDFSSAEVMKTWGTTSEKNYISGEFQKAKDWSIQNRIPVIISEFGAVHDTDYNSRMRHYAHYVEESLSRGISFMAWDDGGWYEIYQRGAKKWHETKDILIYNTNKTPTNLIVTMNPDSTVMMEWENRNTSDAKLRIERKLHDEFEIIDEIDPTSTSYNDVLVEPGDIYQYRISQIVDEKLIISYPQKVDLKQYVREPYGGTSITIPGILEAENFDKGGQNFTYYDNEAENQGGAYREEGVDIEERKDGGFHVGYLEVDEWMEYSVNVAKAGNYTFTTLVAAQEKGGKFQLSASKSNLKTSVDIPSTNSWENTTEVNADIYLEEGEQILRITILKTPAFNIDKLVFAEKVDIPTSLEDELSNVQALIYPNPFSSSFTLRFSEDTDHGKSIEIYNVVGNVVSVEQVKGAQATITLEQVPEGVYFVKYQSNGRDYVKKIIKK
ncbi:cellulase family glycosylhydrolase [Flammeovirga aprica]|uniref:Cellulase family glycosylhydrolase n=1 Tax=Flammeovirga aprica JL-4 TaxID=694437 RepID=A0A7X9P2K7_9BACT|nr:cellulase family glycosylhydrolase [Flammeovirga aprica]NME67499.1 cellulase family glycosylhydrolase [Flammeovirga aprica JL-4]